MRNVLTILALCLATMPTDARAERTRAPRRQPAPTYLPAQDAAEQLAAEGRLRHKGNSGGATEGIGFSTASPDAAIAASCYWGQRTPTEIGVARGRRGWYAVIRYE
jgi:hypothetical protein